MFHSLTVQRLLAWFVPFATTCAVVAYLVIYAVDLGGPPIRSDGYGYYIYLPATFIHHDPTLERTANDCCGGAYPVFSLISRWPETGRWENPHPIGEAIMLVPFFVLADLLTRWSNTSRDGFSLYYQFVIGFGGVFYFAAGIALLKRVLARKFSPAVVLATLVAIVWGTDLFHYATYDSVFSHAFSFFLFAALLYATPRWLEAPSYRGAILLGALCSLLVLVRHIDVLLLLFVALYGITSMSGVGERFALLQAHWRKALVGVVTFLAILAPQLALYRYATGRWMLNPYRSIGSFNFSSPKIPQVLFSSQKGLFFWSPILLLSVAGIPLMRRRAPELLLPTLIVLPAITFAIASWIDWQMGGSFGHRGYTDMMPVFAVAMAALFSEVRGSRFQWAVALMAALFISLSIVQMLQYWLHIIPFANTTWAQYRANFLRLSR